MPHVQNSWFSSFRYNYVLSRGICNVVNKKDRWWLLIYSKNMARCKSQESAAAHAGRALKYRWSLRLTTHVNKYTTAIPNMENVLWKMLWSTSRPVTYYEYINMNVLTYFDCPTIVLLDLIMGEHLTVLHYKTLPRGSQFNIELYFFVKIY